MNRNKLKAYAPQARRDFIKAVTDRAVYYGLTENKIEPITEQGDVAIIAGKAFPKAVATKRKLLEKRIRRQGFEQVMEALAYTWFNRFVAIRFMELRGYFDHGYRVLTHPEGKTTPEILEHAEHLDLPGLDREKVIGLKLEGTKESELYRLLLIAQCKALHKAMPFLFEWIDDETELLLPENLLHTNSLIRKLVNEIPEEEWQEVEIIGWLYQFYLSEKKDQVIGKVMKSEDIPAATQLFTPNWIVKYLVQNSLGRKWIATYPNSPLKKKMEFLTEPAEHTPEVQEQLRAITPESLNPDELTLLDPACGSGHILVEAYDLLKAIYQERGYRARDIPRLILEKNLYGLEIDDRAAQLSAFALMMKARADDRRIFESGVQPQVFAIQESKDMDAKEITDALNAPLEQSEKKGQTGDISQADVTNLIDLFEHGKTFGSLIRVPEKLAAKLPAIVGRVKHVVTSDEMFAQAAARSLKPLAEQARLLVGKYDAVVMNPPYMGSLFASLKSFARKQYPASKSDLFAMFIERGFELASDLGYNAMVTMHSWMYLGAYRKLRQTLLCQHTIESMAHLGPWAFSEISGEVVQVTAFSARKKHLTSFRPAFQRLVDGKAEEKREALVKGEHRFTNASQDDFDAIPGSPIAYWITDRIRDLFMNSERFDDFAETRIGLITGDNARFVRNWQEVVFASIGFSMTRDEARDSRKKWFPQMKGGELRKWYGNHETVVLWENDGHVLQTRKHPTDNRIMAHNFNLDYIFKEGLTWTKISSGKFVARWQPKGFIFNDASASAFSYHEQTLSLLGFLCSPMSDLFLRLINPTLNYLPGNIGSLPIVSGDWLRPSSRVSAITKKCIAIAREDWDDSEISWDFQACPIMRHLAINLAQSWRLYQNECQSRIAQLKNFEEENNRLLIELYGVQDQLSAAVSEEEIALYRPERTEDVKRLISYTIGCMMGRYSLDKQGLIYARSGNQGFDPSQYKTFPADQDGIVPITDTDWFEDDAANRVAEFINVAWPKEHLEESLKFVADSLGSKRGESSRETIRRYLAVGFYKHHLSMYKKRPIHWLFSSGKERAFQCLVYLHRYNEGTLSRMRTEYVIPLQGKISARIDQLAGDITSATSSAHRKKLERERDRLIKQQVELLAFDEKLRHYADRRISLDLDNGVKVNYCKFGDLLAEVKTVTGKRPD